MDDKNKDQTQDEYIQNVDESTLSNPFSNAFKNILQKLHLIKSDQKLIGTKETNSKGYQITSKNPLEATDKKSLKAILRNAFENHQQKRAEKIRAKTATNTIPKYTIGKQEPLVEQNQTNLKDQTHEFIRPKTDTEKAAMRAQNSAPTLGTITLDEAVVEDINKAKLEESAFESDSSSDAAPIGTDLEQEVVQDVAPATTMSTGTIVTRDAERDNDKKTKHTIRKKSETENRDLEL